MNMVIFSKKKKRQWGFKNEQCLKAQSQKWKTIDAHHMTSFGLQMMAQELHCPHTCVLSFYIHSSSVVVWKDTSSQQTLSMHQVFFVYHQTVNIIAKY